VEVYGIERLLEFQGILPIPNLQLLLDQEKCEIDMSNGDIMREIEILMADKDVQFKLKTLKIEGLSRNQIHILDWLLLKSPNLIDFNIKDCWEMYKEGRGLEI
jgi:hypothetical protein